MHPDSGRAWTRCPDNVLRNSSTARPASGAPWVMKPNLSPRPSRPMPRQAGMPLMRATELRAVHLLTPADIVQVGNDPRFFNVVGVERASDAPDARYRVTLRSLDDSTGVMLVRVGAEDVLAVPRA